MGSTGSLKGQEVLEFFSRFRILIHGLKDSDTF